MSRIIQIITTTIFILNKNINVIKYKFNFSTHFHESVPFRSKFIVVHSSTMIFKEEGTILKSIKIMLQNINILQYIKNKRKKN